MGQCSAPRIELIADSMELLYDVITMTDTLKSGLKSGVKQAIKENDQVQEICNENKSCPQLTPSKRTSHATVNESTCQMLRLTSPLSGEDKSEAYPRRQP